MLIFPLVPKRKQYLNSISLSKRKTKSADSGSSCVFYCCLARGPSRGTHTGARLGLTLNGILVF